MMWFSQIYVFSKKLLINIQQFYFDTDIQISGGVHSGSGTAEAGGDVPVLAPLPQPQEADRGQVLPSQQEHDHAETHQTLQVRGERVIRQDTAFVDIKLGLVCTAFLILL